MDSSRLDRAVAGDEQAFRELVAPHLPELQVHCYRMLGSLTDAEDLVQETLLAAWRGLAGFERRASLRTWLYRIATRRCLNARRDAARRGPLAPVPPFPVPEPTRRDEVARLQPYPDALLGQIIDPAPGPDARYTAGEAIELAFVTAVARLPPRQAAVLLLRDVLGFSTEETAAMTGTGATAVKGVLQRARTTLGRHHTGSPAPRPDRATEHDIARRFAEAYRAADVDAVVALLTDEAWLSMPPAPHRYHGRDAIAAFLDASFTWRGDRRVQLLAAGRANTHPAFGRYLADPDGDGGEPAGLYVLAVAGNRIHQIIRFHRNELFPRFGLPQRLPRGASGVRIG